MGQCERGLNSECRCPSCGYACSVCLGTDSVLSRNELVAAGERLGWLGDDPTELSSGFEIGEDEAGFQR